MTTTKASPEPENERAEDRTKPAATPRKAWSKPVVRRIYQGLFLIRSSGPQGPHQPESPTYHHIS